MVYLFLHVGSLDLLACTGRGHRDPPAPSEGMLCARPGCWRLLWAILPRYRKLARENLSAAFGNEKSSSEIRWLTFRHFATLGANGICSFKFAALPRDVILRIAPFENSEVVRRNILAGRGVVLAISHLGSWELYAQAAFQRPETRFGTIYQALRNPYLDELINRDRRKGVDTLIARRGSKPPSPCCASRDPRQCWWIKVPVTEESGCPSSTACVPPLLWQPLSRFARILLSCRAPSSPPDSPAGASSIMKRYPIDQATPTNSPRISMPFLSVKSVNRLRIGSGCTTAGKRHGRASFSQGKNAGPIFRPAPIPRRSIPFVSLCARQTGSVTPSWPSSRTRLQARSPRRPACRPHSGKTRRLLEFDRRGR